MNQPTKEDKIDPVDAEEELSPQELKFFMVELLAANKKFAEDMKTIMKKINVMGEDIQEVQNKVLMNENEFEGLEKRLSAGKKDSLDTEKQPSRRSTLFARDLLIPDATTEGSQSRDKIILTSEHKVSREDKIKTASVSSWLKLSKTYEEYKATSRDNTLGLVNFLSQEVHEVLINNEKLHDTRRSVDLDIHSIYKATDADIMDMFARAVRPTSKEKYKEMIVKTVPKLRPESDSWTTLRVERYHTDGLFKPLDKLCTCLEDVETIVRHNASTEEIEALPKLEWGKEKNPGVFQILLLPFHKWKDPLITLIGEEKLKKCDSVKELVTWIRMANKDLAQKALKLEKDNAKCKVYLKEENTYDALVSKVNESKLMQQNRFTPKERLKSQEDGPRKSIGTHAKGYSKPHMYLCSNTEKSSTKTQPDSSDDDTLPLVAEGDFNGDDNSFNSLPWLESDRDSDTDDEERSKGLPRKDEPLICHTCNHATNEDLDAEVPELKFLGNKPTPPPRPAPHIGATKNPATGQVGTTSGVLWADTSKMPCWRFVEGTCLDATKCKFSHHPTVIGEAIKKKVDFLEKFSREKLRSKIPIAATTKPTK